MRIPTTAEFWFVLLAFVIGVLVVPLHLSIGIWAVLTLCFGICWIFFIPQSLRWGCVALIPIVLLGIVRTEMLPLITNTFFDTYVGTTEIFQGTIIAAPDVRTNSQQLTVLLGVASSTQTTHALITVGRYPEYSYGDLLTLEGKLTIPKDVQPDQMRPAFHYQAYLATQGIGYVMYMPHVEVVGHTEGNVVDRVRFGIRHYLRLKIEHVFPEPDSGLIAGMLIGAKRALSQDDLNMFRYAGLIHIVVLSGFNMTITAEGFMRLAALAPFYVRLGIGAFAIVLLALVAEGGGAVTRAAIMALLGLFARATGRTTDVGRLLVIAATTMIAVNPRILLDDPSFQLSFLATAGIIYITPYVEARLAFITWKNFRALITSTVSVQCAVLPHILYLSGTFAPWALIANLLVLPIVPLTMGLSALATIAGSFFLPLGQLIGVIALPFTWWTRTIAEVVANFPGSHAGISGFPLGVDVCVTTFVFYVFAWLTNRLVGTAKFNTFNVAQK